MLVILLLLVLTGAAGAQRSITLIVNGKLIQPDVPPQIVNGRTMVPVRWVSEALDADVNWDDATSTVIIASKKTGTVTGVLTYYYNTNFGYQPDVGARAYLVRHPQLTIPKPAKLPISAVSDLELGVSRPPAYYTATADATGRYTIRDVQPGTYILAVVSAHSTRAPWPGLTKEEMQTWLELDRDFLIISGVGAAFAESAEAVRRLYMSWRFENWYEVEVLPGTTIDRSARFEISAF